MNNTKKNLLNCLFVILFFYVIKDPAVATAESVIIKLPKEIYDMKKIDDDTGAIIHLTNDDYLLDGLIDQGQFFYEVPIQGLKKGNYLQLTVEYSELLLKGSTLTIYIDEQPIKSVDLNHKKTSMDINVPLPKEALAEGYHDVAISFYGNIAQNLCVNRENPANWLTISSSSYLYLNTKDLIERKDPLFDYPYPFIQNSNDEPIQGVIVIPDEPTVDILSSAFKIANYLNSHVVGEEKVNILTESELDGIFSHLIVVGQKDQFSGKIKKLVTLANITVPDEEVVLSNRYVQFSEHLKQVLFMTASDDQIISDNVSLLTEDQFIKQLSGNDLSVSSLPHLPEVEVEPKKKLSDLNISNITLTGINSASHNYFYTLPTYIDSQRDAILHLKLNVSDTLFQNDKFENGQREKAELLVMINEIPHSVAIDNLNREEFDGFYHAQIPISVDTLQKEPYLAIQYRGLGLREREICVPPSDDKWIFIHEDSFIQFNVLETSVTDNFKSWPAPFISTDNSIDAALIIPNDLNKDGFQQIQILMNSLGKQSTLQNLKILFEKDITEEILNEHHVLFLGNIDYLKMYDELLIKLDNRNQLDVSEYEFIKETSKNVAWIQPSLWNDQKLMAVFSSVDQTKTDQFLSKNIIEYIDLNTEDLMIIVESDNGEIFTKKTFDNEKESDKTTLGKSKDIWLIASFIIIFIVGLIVLIFVYRKSKRAKYKI